MRIAVWHNLPSGGGKRALYNHVRGLVARGHEVVSWCPPSADQTYLPLSSLITEHVVELDDPVARPMTDFWQLTLPIDRSRAAMVAHCKACSLQIDSGEFDILFANSCKYFRTSPISRFVRTPSVIYLGEPYRSLYEALPTLCWIARDTTGQRWWTVRNIRAAFSDIRELRNKRVQAREELEDAKAYNRVLVNSHFSRESVLRAYGIDSTVCYLGIDVSQWADLETAENGSVVGLASIIPEKNVMFCVEAISLTKPPRPKLVWIANIADSGYLSSITQSAQKLGVVFEPRIRIDDDQLRAILAGATAMVYSPRLEPFGLAPLEANAAGIPVVAVAEGGVRETVINGVNGLIAESNPASMAAALDRIRFDRSFAQQLRRSARDYVAEAWDFESSIDRIEAELRRYAREPHIPLSSDVT